MSKRKKLSQKEKNFLLFMADYKCENRHCECDNLRVLEFDHVIPLARGGDDDVRNMQVLCNKCNSRKSDSSDGVFDYDSSKVSGSNIDDLLSMVFNEKNWSKG